MAAIKGPEEVYRKYLDRFGLDGDGDPDALALFSYALVERDRFNWIEHHRAEHQGASPTSDEVSNWFACKPESYFDDTYRRALGWYTDFARALLADEIKESNDQAIRDYIGDKLNFWPQVGMGLVGNLLFLLVIGLLSVAIFTDFSPIAWTKHHFNAAETRGLPIETHPSPMPQ